MGNCLFCRIKKYSNNKLFYKIDIIWNNIKNGGSDTVHKFLSMTCIQNFLATTMPEDTRKHPWRQDILIAKKYGTSDNYRDEKCKLFWCKIPPRPTSCIFFLSYYVWQALWPAITMLDRLSGQLPQPKFIPVLDPASTYIIYDILINIKNIEGEYYCSNQYHPVMLISLHQLGSFLKKLWTISPTKYTI